MNENDVPYRRKALYLLLTIPMIVMYGAIAVFLWTVHHVYFVIYAAFFVLVAILQSYVCVHWQCPYVGRFAPCVGGFCLPSSQIARLFKGVKRSEKVYTIVLTLAYVNFFGVILFPIYFIYRQSLVYVLIYVGIVAVYALCFLLFICPVCATRHVCPGGQTAMQLKNKIKKRGVQE
jgi:hypothetical protein